MSLEKLATYATTDDNGKDFAFRMSDLRYAREHPSGAELFFDDGFKIVVQASVATITSAIDAKWDEYAT